MDRARCVYTLHAVERFIERIDPSLTRSEARCLLEAADFTVTRRKAMGRRGGYIMHVAGAVAVVKHEDGHLIVKTILGPIEEGNNDRC